MTQVVVVFCPGAFQRLREMFEAGPAQKSGEQPLIIRHHDDSARRFRGVEASWFHVGLSQEYRRLSERL